jgi:hypothetical protein
MLNTDMKLRDLENDKRICNEVTEILRVLTNAEKQSLNLYNPLKQIEVILNDVQDRNLLILYQHLLNGFQTETTDGQIWADNYFTFVLLLCDLLGKTRTKVNQTNITDTVNNSLVPA